MQNNYSNVNTFYPLALNEPGAWVGHLPFAHWIVSQLQPSKLVELGTHTGNSYFTMCQSVNDHGLSTICSAVDTWQGDEHAGHYDDSVYTEVNTYNKVHYADFSQLLRMTFDDALEQIKDHSVDLLHIDGLHTYDAVKHDFESWLPKLTANAIVMFHDTCVFERNFGVHKLWEELTKSYPLNYNFTNSHGLGVLCVGDSPTERIRSFFAKTKERDFLAKSLANHGEMLINSLKQKTLLSTQQDQYNQLLNNHNKLSNRYGELAIQHCELSSQHGKLSSQHDQLEHKHDQLEHKHDQLEHKHDQLSNRYGELAIQHCELSSQHGKLSSQHDQLTNQHNELNSQCNEQKKLLAVSTEQNTHLYKQSSELQSSLAQMSSIVKDLSYKVQYLESKMFPIRRIGKRLKNSFKKRLK